MIGKGLFAELGGRRCRKGSGRGAIAGRPMAGRPKMPASYGVEQAASADMVDWSAVGERLASARNYWVATTRPDVS